MRSPSKISLIARNVAGRKRAQKRNPPFSSSPPPRGANWLHGPRDFCVYLCLPPLIGLEKIAPKFRRRLLWGSRDRGENFGHQQEVTLKGTGLKSFFRRSQDTPERSTLWYYTYMSWYTCLCGIIRVVAQIGKSFFSPPPPPPPLLSLVPGEIGLTCGGSECVRARAAFLFCGK